MIDAKNIATNDYWTSPKVVLKCVGPKLVPFFKTVCIYFVLADRESPSWITCLLKILPIVCLCVFVVLHGISLNEKHTYARRVLLGLIFSGIGDALLVWPWCFIWGLGSFAVAHVLYISAFAFQPINIPAGVVCTVLGISVYYFITPGITGVLTYAVPVYMTVLLLMVWRAVARVQFFEDLWTWTTLCSCFGGILFAVSDTLLGLNAFGINVFGAYSVYSQPLVMVTYYTAQLGIALSVVDNKAIAALSAANEANSNVPKMSNQKECFSKDIPSKDTSEMLPVNTKKGLRGRTVNKSEVTKQ